MGVKTYSVTKHNVFQGSWVVLGGVQRSAGKSVKKNEQYYAVTGKMSYFRTHMANGIDMDGCFLRHRMMGGEWGKTVARSQ